MHLPSNLRRASFLERANRFACWVEVEGRREKAHLANSGRLGGLLTPGRTVYVVEAPSPRRLTRFDLALAELDGMLVSVDARLPGHLVEEGIRAGTLPPFRGFTTVRREVSFGHSRLDFCLGQDGQSYFVEVKSVTLVRQGQALFPDAPTARGSRHLLSLIQAREVGYGAAIVFVAQRPDAIAFSPNDAIDPHFGHTLCRALVRGVRAYAFRCQVSLVEIKIEKEIPVLV